MRDKGEFRAIRMRCGISHAFLARKVGCSVALARKWDDASSNAYPPKEAWDIVDEALEWQRGYIWQLIDIVDKIEEEGTQDDSEFRVATFSSEKRFRDTTSPEFLAAYDGDWQQMNARNIALMVALDVLGYDCAYSDGDISEPR